MACYRCSVRKMKRSIKWHYGSGRAKTRESRLEPNLFFSAPLTARFGLLTELLEQD